MDWIEVEGKTDAEAEAELLEKLGETDIGKLEIEKVKVKRMFLGMGGRTVKLKGRLKEAPPAREAKKEVVDELAETIQEVHNPVEAPQTTHVEAPAPAAPPAPSAPANGVVTGATKYHPWVAEGPGAILLPPEGKGYSRRKYDPNPSLDNEDAKEENLDIGDGGNENELETEEEFVPPVYEDVDDSPVMAEDRDRAVAFVNGVIDKMNMSGEVKGYRLADRLLIQIDSDNGGLLIGRKGLTLDSLQYLTDIIINKKRESRIRIILDTEHYKERRRFKVFKIATAAADKAVRIHKPVRLFPMNPTERQIVHSSLADDGRVETISEGEGARRRVVVFPRDKRKDQGERR
ncbi:MAG TPA: KH domain-containing protein [Nitrospirae bacterium]|nr:KH domain-containing protein [Nitrospirota bacterium]